MGKVVFDISMSLDGFIAGPNDGLDEPLGEGGERLHSWLAADQTDVEAELFESSQRAIGAVICGRRTYDNSEWIPGYGPAGKTPVFVVTHRTGGDGLREGPFTLVDGIQSAVKQAQTVAGDKEVSVMGGADIAAQLLRAGLVDEVVIHLVPVLLSGGRRLFANLGPDRIELRPIEVIGSPRTSHLRFHVVR